RSRGLHNGATYPALPITVSVAGNPPASVPNTATVAGGGELNTANNSANDPTTITPAGNAPTGINLSNNSVPEQLAAGTNVGALTAVDPDGPTGPFTFSFVNDTPQHTADNAKFQILPASTTRR